MDNIQRECIGRLKVSEDVIIGIAENVIKETKGIEECKKYGLFRRNSGVSVRFEKGAAKISAEVNVKYGSNAVTCAETLQRKIRTAVQDMTGVMVQNVNVRVVSLV